MGAVMVSVMEAQTAVGFSESPDIAIPSKVARVPGPRHSVRYRIEITPHRKIERRLGAGCDMAVPPRAIDAIEGKWRDGPRNAPHRRSIERDVVRIAVHETEGTAVRRHHGDVAGQQCAAPLRAGAPMQERGASKMPA